MSDDEKKEVLSMDWVRGPKRVDLSRANVHKLQKAVKERGIRIEMDGDLDKGDGRATVTKVVIQGKNQD